MTAGEGDVDDDDDLQEPDSSTQLLQEQPSPPRSPSKLKAGTKPTENLKKPNTGKHASGTPVSTGAPLIVKVRLSTRSKDIKVPLSNTSRVRDLKRKLVAEHNVDASKITMLYSGRVLSNGTLLKDLDIPKGFVIQAIVTDAQ